MGRVARYGGLLAVAAALVVTTAGAAGAVDAVPLPMKGPPGANVSVNVTNCPAGTTETIAVRLRIASSSPLPFDPAEPGVVVVPATEPTVVVPFRVPIDANPGAYAFDVFCLGAGNTVVDGPATVPFEVALLPVRVTPNQGPLGTQITVSGSGCPTGLTDIVAVRIEGASDDVPLWDPAAPDAFRFERAARGRRIVFDRVRGAVRPAARRELGAGVLHLRRRQQPRGSRLRAVHRD